MRHFWSVAAIAALAAAVFAQTPPPAQSPSAALLAAARAALGPPAESLEIAGAFRRQFPNSSRQQQGTLEIRMLGSRDYQRRMAMKLPFGDLVTTETLADGEVSVKRDLPPGLAQRFAAFRRNRGAHLTAAERAKFRERRQAMLLRSVSAQAARDALTFLRQPPPGATLSYAGLAQARNGQQADMVAVSWPGSTRPVTLFLDHHSHRLLMLSYLERARSFEISRRPGASGPPSRRELPPPKPRTIYVHLTHWRQIQGRWFPFEITESAAGKTFSEWDLKRVRVNAPQVTAQGFQKP